MQTQDSTRPAAPESTGRAQAPRHAGTEDSCPDTPVITITENALKHIRDRRESLGLPVKGLRVNAIPRSALRAVYSMRFVPAEEPECPTDAIQSFQDIDLYIARESAHYLEGATIDFVFRLIGSGLQVLAPLRKLDTPDGRVAAKVQRVLDEEVNPSLATHGGAATLIDFKDGVAFVELTGGCQGCSMVGATLKGGIERSIRQGVREVVEVRDVTNHANGSNPYFRK